jgi:beta-N-acetylhexosaminidase
MNKSLLQAAGSLVVGKVAGTTISAENERLLSEGIIGGVTLFKENAVTLKQTAELVDSVIKLRGPDTLVAVDQEGGAVQRLDDVLTPLPSAMAFGALADPESLRRLMSISARQLALLGVNCVLAPVLDVASNPLSPIIGTRSFGSNPQKVVELAGVVIDCYLQEGVMPVGKHFPGHGDTMEDSHNKLAEATADKQTLGRRELYPFKMLTSRLPAVLTGHLWLKALQKDAVPASLAPEITSELLRQQLGFSGLVLTDDLPVMKAIIDNYGLAQAAVMAIKAGADVLLVSGETGQMEEVTSSLVHAVEGGTISKTRLEESIKRRQSFLNKGSLARQRHSKSLLVDRIAMLEKSVEDSFPTALATMSETQAMVRGSMPDLDSVEGDLFVLLPKHSRYSFNLVKHLGPLIGANKTNIVLKEERYDINPEDDEIDRLVESCQSKPCILVTFRALLNRGQLALADKLAHQSSSFLLVASDVPYEIVELKQCANALALFDPSDLSMNALALTIAGKHSPASRSTLP